jgi:hypothetical protein
MAATTAHADPKAEVFAAWDAMIAAKSYRATVETTANNQVFTQTIEMIIPDQMRMTGGPGGDLVITTAGAWIKAPGQEWTEAPPGTAAMSKQFMSEEFVAKAKAGVKSVEALGTEDVAGKPARTYRVEQTMTMMGIESQSSTKLYVDAESGRPIRQEVDATAMGRSSRTVQDIEYVADLKIVAPK